MAEIPRLVTLFCDHNRYNRSSAAKSFGKLVEQPAFHSTVMAEIPRLVTLLSDQNSAVRFSAFRSFGKLVEQPVFHPAVMAEIPRLVTLLSDEDGDVRSSTADLFGKLVEQPAFHPAVMAEIPRLVPLLSDHNWYNRSSAAELFGKLVEQPAFHSTVMAEIPRLVTLLSDQTSAVRFSAFQSFGKLVLQREFVFVPSLPRHQDTGINHPPSDGGLTLTVVQDNHLHPDNSQPTAAAAHTDYDTPCLNVDDMLTAPSFSAIDQRHLRSLPVEDADNTSLPLKVPVSRPSMIREIKNYLIQSLQSQDILLDLTRGKPKLPWSTLSYTLLQFNVVMDNWPKEVPPPDQGDAGNKGINGLSTKYLKKLYDAINESDVEKRLTFRKKTKKRGESLASGSGQRSEEWEREHAGAKLRMPSESNEYSSTGAQKRRSDGDEVERLNKRFKRSWKHYDATSFTSENWRK